MSAVLPARRTRFVDVLAMEWTKVSTLPSTLFGIAITLVIGIGLSALVSGFASDAYAHRDNPAVRVDWDPTVISTAGGSMAQIALAVVAALVITAEISTGEIGSSLAAVPTRWRLLLAKSAVVAVIGFVTAEVVEFVSFFIGQALISGKAPTASIDQPGVLRALLGAGLYVAVLAVASLALGTLLRGTASTVVVLVMMLYVLPPVMTLLPRSWRRPLLEYWPTEAGQQVLAVVRRPDTLPPWVGLAVMAGFAAAVLVAAGVALDRRDI